MLHFSVISSDWRTICTSCIVDLFSYVFQPSFSLIFRFKLDVCLCQSLDWGYLRIDRTSFGDLLWMKHNYFLCHMREISNGCGLVNLCGKNIWFRFSFISLECCLVCVIYASLCILQLFVHLLSSDLIINKQIILMQPCLFFWQIESLMMWWLITINITSSEYNMSSF